MDRCRARISTAPLDLWQDLVDHDAFRGGLAERGIQSVPPSILESHTVGQG